MKLVLIRHRYTNSGTFGRLYIDGEFECYTLEDTARPFGVKVKHHTAIPTGLFKIKLYTSPRFKRVLPLIYTEKDEFTLKAGGIVFRYALFHAGNKVEDTSGCILVGDKELIGSVGDSRKAEKNLWIKLVGERNVTLEVINLKQEA